MFKSLFNKDGQGKGGRSAGAEETSHYQKEMIEPSTIDSFELGPILGTGRYVAAAADARAESAGAPAPIRRTCARSRRRRTDWPPLGAPVARAPRHVRPGPWPPLARPPARSRSRSFGRVPLARHKATKRTVAIKMLSKSQILKTKQVTHIKAEKEILMAVSHPFIVSLYGSSQDKECLYFILEYVVGGEFFTHLRSQGRFSEDTSRFYASEILLTFEYLHGMDIIYRDLKPENLLLDKTGHIKITDFGFAKKIDHRTYTLCGTPDYLAPEIILNKGHGKPVDWWAMGVLIYEMMAGYPPFYDEDPMGTYQKILHGKLEFASHFSRGARDLVKKLLQVRARATARARAAGAPPRGSAT